MTVIMLQRQCYRVFIVLSTLKQTFYWERLLSKSKLIVNTLPSPSKAAIFQAPKDCD